MRCIMKNTKIHVLLILVLLLCFSGCYNQTMLSSDTIELNSNYIPDFFDDFISIDNTKYYDTDKYGNRFSSLYRLFSSKDNTVKALYNPQNSEPYEITVKVFENKHFILYGSFWLNLLGDPLVFASEEICALQYLEDITLCSKITVESIGSSCFADGEHELSTELNAAIYSSVAKKYLQNNMGLSKADIYAETYTVYIYLKGIDAAVEVALVTSDIDGKVGILTDENTVIPLEGIYQNSEVFVSEVL